jgi:SAM-dependent methyltransferase
MDDPGRDAARKLDAMEWPGGLPASLQTSPGTPTGIGREWFDIQVRLSPGGMQVSGRASQWRDAAMPGGFQPIADWLGREGAPEAVRDAQAAPGARRQGIARAQGPDGPAWRFFRHDAPGHHDTPIRETWCWRPGGSAERHAYRFAFLPDDAALAGLVPGWAAPVLEALLGTADATAMSGVWRGEDRLAIALPTLPEPGATPGLRDLPAIFGLDGQATDWLRRLPVRHVVLHPAEAEPRASLRLGGWLPAPAATEDQARDAVIAAARADRPRIAALMQGLAPPTPTGAAALLDGFYSGDTAAWRTVLGEGLHYHHGLFDGVLPSDPTDAAMLAAVRRAVEEFYPFVPPGSRVYDLGCGWGGPLAMLARERGCEVIGVTAARGQFDHVARMGLPVRHADAEHSLPPGAFDSVLMLESLEHIHDKPGLLRRLRPFARQLVIRTNCQDAAPPSTRFAGTMPMVSSSTLRALLEEAGWTIRHWRDRRAEAMPSPVFWSRRVRLLPPMDDPHLAVLRTWSDRVVRLGALWGQSNPLIEIVAD